MENNMLKATKLQTLLEHLRSLENEQSKFIDSIPSEVNTVFFDNTYVSCLHKQVSQLIEFSFDGLAEDVNYFLYEPYPQKIQTTQAGEVKNYSINSAADFIEYLVDMGQVEDDRDCATARKSNA